MSTFTQILYHIVFSTKNRVPALTADHREELFRYTWGFIKNKNCCLYRINGVGDHIHVLCSLHPTLCLSDYIRDMKIATSKWIKERGHFPQFTHWQDGYGAFTVSYRDKSAIAEYIKGQEDHHRTVPFKDELMRLLKNAGIEFDEKYLV